MKTLRLFVLLMIGSCVFPAFIAAAIHFVSPMGSASWAQSSSIASPCSTAVAFTNAQAGDTVYFRGGTYRTQKRNFGDSYSGYYNPANSGTSSSYIVFMAYPSSSLYFRGWRAAQVIRRALAQIFTQLFLVQKTNRILSLMGLVLKLIQAKKWQE